jgi:hypothetical protein
MVQINQSKILEWMQFFFCPKEGEFSVLEGASQGEALIQVGALFRVRNGVNCRFWQDCWVMSVPLKVAFEDLFRLARDLEVSVSECWVDDDWWIDFKRALSAQDFGRWNELKGELSRITLD